MNILTTTQDDDTGNYALSVYSDLYSLTGDSVMAMKQTLLNLPAIMAASRNGVPALDMARKLETYGVAS